ncbi:MAG: flavodoxin [Treponemataceae bacterium]|nr:flavodoxin [Treponemataceae bacterium]
MRKTIVLAAIFAFFAGNMFAQGTSLVVYFSHTGEQYGVGEITEGNTAVIAKMIAQKVGANIFEIVPEEDYQKRYRSCVQVAKQEKRAKSRPTYVGDVDVSSYDTIFIGYPIWFSDLPMVVYTFLESHDLHDKTIVPFCTHEGSGSSKTDDTIKRLFATATVKKIFELRGSVAQNERDEACAAVDKWFKELGL